MTDTPPERSRAQVEPLVERLLRGEPQAIARAITAIENGDQQREAVLRQIFPHTGKAVLVGVTGAPGTGKSTLVDCLAKLLRKQGHAVGILAIDPTSPFTGGAILGDRVRMQEHAADPGVFIRSMATRGTLGGLAAATADAALVLDAAGKEFILIETVGVGQDEVEIAHIADVTLLVLVPGLGDEVQAFKAGVMEIADIFVLNKSDYAGVDQLESHVRAALPDSSSQRPVLRTVATRSEGVSELVEHISQFLERARRSGSFDRRRKAYWQNRLLEIMRARLLQQILPQPGQEDRLAQQASAVATRAADPYTAVEQLFGNTAQALAGMPENLFAGAELDHLGVAVRSMEEAVAFYEQALGLRVSGYETITAEKTRVAMLPVGRSRIELLEATEPDSPIARFIAKRGAGLHHICLRVPDLTAAVEHLRQRGARLINESPGVGAGGHRYVFVHPSSSGGVLLELVEAGTER